MTSFVMPVLAVQVAQNVFFGIIAAVMIVAALRMVTTKNIVHAALYLVVVLAGVAGQFILLGAEFAGATQVLVYIGAVVVLFLFGIMLTRAKIGSEERADHDNKIPAILTAVLLLAVMGYAILDFSVIEPESAIEFTVDKTTSTDVLEAQQEVFDNETWPAYLAEQAAWATELADYNLARDAAEAQAIAAGTEASFTFRAAPPAPVEPEEPSDLGFGQISLEDDSTRMVSDAIFSQYIVAFEAISVLLLAALIGAIVIARKE